jgi:hypothetical protein
MGTHARTIVCAFAAVMLTACAAPVPRLSPTGEVGPDGLQRLAGSSFDEVWARPGLRVEAHPGIALEPTRVSYREVDEDIERDLTRERSRREVFPIPAHDRERIEARFQFRVEEALDGSTTIRRVESARPGALHLYAELVDYVSMVPPLDPQVRTYVRSVGEAVLHFELRDGQTGAVLARGAKRSKAGPRDYRLIQGGTVGSWPEVERQMTRWARDLGGLLEGLYEMSGG